jgi:hypothetical protein
MPAADRVRRDDPSSGTLSQILRWVSMSENDESTVHKLATIVADAVKAVEAKIDDAMVEADAELVKGPSHIGEGEPDVFGFLPDDTTDLSRDQHSSFCVTPV